MVPGDLAALRRSWTGCTPAARASGADAVLPEKAESEFAEIMRRRIQEADYRPVNGADADSAFTLSCHSDQALGG